MSINYIKINKLNKFCYLIIFDDKIKLNDETDRN